MTDKELLEYAARAAGMGPFIWIEPDGTKIVTNLSWNPLEDDGDALRLAVKLQMSLDTALGQSLAIALGGRDCIEPHNSDPLAATRLAITRAAAEIGRSMK